MAPLQDKTNREAGRRFTACAALPKQFRRFAITIVCFSWLMFGTSGKPALAQETGPQAPDFTRNPEAFPRIFNPYRSQKISEPDLTNSPAVSQMIRDGKLQLSVSQLLTLVMENNLDLLSDRYNRFFSQTDVLRAKAGGAPRGSQGVLIPSGLFSSAIGAGLGSLAPGFSPATGPVITSAAKQVSITPRGAFDPDFSLNFSIDRSDSPLNSIRVTGVPNSITSTATLQARYAQAFTSGTTFSFSLNTQRQSSNGKNLVYNPAYVPSFSVTLTQQLLNGFGFAVNRRYLDVANNGRQIAREFFRQQVMTLLAQAQDSYWDLVAFRETVRSAEQARQVAQQLYENNKKQAEVGTLAPLDVVSAESEVASRERDLIIAQTNLQKSEVQLKTLLSKQLDSPLADAPIEPTDPLPDPQDTDIPGLQEALASASRNRPELTEAEANILNQEVAVNFSKDSLKPSLQIFGIYTSSSLYGTALIPDPTGGIAPLVVPGGLSTAFSQLVHFQYPDYAFGLSLTIPIKNRSAQADNFRARIEERQAETTLQRSRNQISLEVRNAVIGLMQSKSQVEAARKAVGFSVQTVDAEQKKLSAGVSTPYNVILVQRDLLAAQLAEVQARANYAKARVEMDRSTGVILEKNNVDPQQVPRGEFPKNMGIAVVE